MTCYLLSSTLILICQRHMWNSCTTSAQRRSPQLRLRSETHVHNFTIKSSPHTRYSTLTTTLTAYTINGEFYPALLPTKETTAPPSCFPPAHELSSMHSQVKVQTRRTHKLSELHLETISLHASIRLTQGRGLRLEGGDWTFDVIQYTFVSFIFSTNVLRP